jgi:hypothetical protein
VPASVPVSTNVSPCHGASACARSTAWGATPAARSFASRRARVAGEPAHEARGDDLADVGHGEERRFVGRLDRLERSEVLRQRARQRLADVADAERKRSRSSVRVFDSARPRARFSADFLPMRSSPSSVSTDSP